MRRVKTPEQLKAWREKNWKPLGYRVPYGYLHNLPVYDDDKEGMALVWRFKLLDIGGTVEQRSALYDDAAAWAAKQEAK